jgi:hypothetical protein
MPATGSPARCCRASGVVVPLYREKEVKTSPPCGEGSLQEKVSLLPGREWRTREGLRLFLLDKASGRVARGSCQDLCVTPHRRAVEALYGGLAEGIITAPEVVMMD